MTYVTRIVRRAPEKTVIDPTISEIIAADRASSDIPVNDPSIDDVLHTAQIEAEEKVREAEASAVAIRSSAELDAETIVKRAEDRAELLSLTAKKELEEELAREKAQALLDHRKAINEDLQNSEQLLCKLVFGCLTKIVGEFSSDEKVSAVVRTAIENLQNRRKVTLVVASEDKALVEQSLQTEAGELPSPISDIVVEQGLDAGECYLDFGKSKLEMDLKSQLSHLSTVLNQKA